MKKLMQHLLDGGKLVDENDGVIALTTDGFSITNNIGIKFEYHQPSTLIGHFAEHDLKPLYTDGLYEVLVDENDSAAQFLIYSEKANTWYYAHPPCHGILCGNISRIIRKLEPQELEL